LNQKPAPLAPKQGQNLPQNRVCVVGLQQIDTEAKPNQGLLHVMAKRLESFAGIDFSSAV